MSEHLLDMSKKFYFNCPNTCPSVWDYGVYSSLKVYRKSPNKSTPKKFR